MNNADNNIIAMALHKTREHEMIARAEKARQVQSLRQQVTQRLRRAVRINNDPVR